MESVMAKKTSKRSRRYPVGFQRDAVERMKHSEDIGKLAEELGVSRGALYLWWRKAQGLPSYRAAARQGRPASAEDPQVHTVRQLEAKVASLEGELGRRSVEISFFRSALRKVEGSSRRIEKPGETQSTKRSATGRGRKA
jgi:transposase-like protein